MANRIDRQLEREKRRQEFVEALYRYALSEADALGCDVSEWRALMLAGAKRLLEGVETSTLAEIQILDLVPPKSGR